MPEKDIKGRLHFHYWPLTIGWLAVCGAIGGIVSDVILGKPQVGIIVGLAVPLAIEARSIKQWNNRK